MVHKPYHCHCLLNTHARGASAGRNWLTCPGTHSACVLTGGVQKSKEKAECLGRVGGGCDEAAGDWEADKTPSCFN